MVDNIPQKGGGVVVAPTAGPQPPTASPTPPDQAEQAKGDEESKREDNEESKTEGDGDSSKNGDVKRPDKPTKIADPNELEAKPDASGKVSFSFNGQTWPDVLQWLANVSGYSLDWTELPSGYLNLTTQRPYSLEEARDLINRQLHARGYTMVVKGGMLSVFKIGKLDPSLIARVDEEDLYDLQPHDYVKITFQLPDSMEVAAAAEDIGKLAGEHAKVIPLPAAKRLLIMTTVANARLISQVLNEERMAADGQVIPEEIVLKHRRAEKVIDIVYVTLGLDPASRPSQEELAVQQQKMQLLMQMQGAGKDVSTMLQKDGPQVYLSYNSHRNSILVNAPPAELKKIRRTIELLDVPAGGAAPSEGVVDSGRRVPKSYKLETIDPRNLQSTLEEIGDLSPLTELRADSKADILFARATQADHDKIVRMIEQLDESGMETAIFRLRKHPADAVADTLRTMFAPKKDEDDSRSRNRYRYYGWYDDDDNEDEAPDIRIDADIDRNRLMVRGTAEQISQVRDFLRKLGEPLDETDNSNRLRVVEALPPEETARLIQQLRRAWPSIGKNKLVIEGPDEPAQLAPPNEADSSEKAPGDREARSGPKSVFRFAAESSARSSSESSTIATDSTSGPPIVIKITPDGRLMLRSEDTAALDRLEELIESASPPQERFKIIQVDYVTAFSIYLTLKNLYKEEMKGEETEGYFDQYMWEYIPPTSKGFSAQMSKRRPLQLDYDPGSNTILVANASPSQLREIEALIRVYDKPSADSEAKSRRTAAIKLKYTRAKVVEEALKGVYRDLLSTRDKEFEKEDQKGGASVQRETTTIIRYGQGSADDSDKRPTPVKVGFQGALSIGIDEVSNTIIISVQEELFESVLMIVKSLDEAAKPQTTVAVHSVGSGISPEALQKALAEALGTPWVGGKPEKPDQARSKGDGQQKPGEGQAQPGRPEDPGGNGE